MAKKTVEIKGKKCTPSNVKWLSGKLIGKILMDYGDKQYFIALRGIVERKEKNWKKHAKELRESFEAAQKAAESGNATGQFNLGMHYYYGFGVEESDEEAFKWYEKAAMQGHSEAMHNYAWCFKGYGIQPDWNKFYEWEKKAAHAYYAESKTADTPETAKDKIGSAVHALLCYADGAKKSTASSGVDNKNQHSVAHNEGLQDEQKREDFSPSSAPGAPDDEVITLFNEMRADPKVQEYVAYRYSADKTFFEDLEHRLKAEC